MWNQSGPPPPPPYPWMHITLTYRMSIRKHRSRKITQRSDQTSPSSLCQLPKNSETTLRPHPTQCQGRAHMEEIGADNAAY